MFVWGYPLVTKMRMIGLISAPLMEKLYHWSGQKKSQCLLDTGIFISEKLRLFHNLHGLLDPLCAVKHTHQIHACS